MINNVQGFKVGESRTLVDGDTSSHRRSHFFPLSVLPPSLFQIEDEVSQQSDTSRRSKDKNKTVDIIELALSILVDQNKSSTTLPSTTRENDGGTSRNRTNDSMEI